MTPKMTKIPKFLIFKHFYASLRTSQRFYSALVILEPQIYVVVEQFGAENIPLLSGRLVIRHVFNEFPLNYVIITIYERNER